MTRDGTVGLYGTDRSPAEQRGALASGRVPVAVYGLGKMGLPLAAMFADVTGNVVGVDVDADRVDAVNRGECPVEREPGLPALVERTVASGSLRATTAARSAADGARVHVVIVPTTLRADDSPDLSALRSVVRDVGAGLTPGDLVAIECTVPPRTCEDVVEPLLVAESGLDAGAFGLAFCPERTSSGRALRDIGGAYSKVVGGTDGESTRAAALVYGEMTDETVLATDATTAECVKVFEGIYRDVNIALANELATFADELDVDVREAIEVANTLPMCDIHDPGPGVGGHCIPYYPYFLLSEFSTAAPLVRTAREVNDAMPAFAVDALRRRLVTTGTPVEDATVVLLGLTYRPGVAETRKSPARRIADLLTDLGATVYGVDPVLDDAEGFALEQVSLADLPALAPDAAVLVTAHEEFESVDWDAFEPMVVVDGRDALDLDGSRHDVYTIGSGRTTAPRSEASTREGPSP